MSKLKTETFADYKKRNSKLKKLFRGSNISELQIEIFLFVSYLRFLNAGIGDGLLFPISQHPKISLIEFFTFTAGTFNEIDFKFTAEQLSLLKVETLEVLFNTVVQLFEQISKAKQFEVLEKIRLYNENEELKKNVKSKTMYDYYKQWHEQTMNLKRVKRIYYDDIFKVDKPELQDLDFEKFNLNFRQYKKNI